LDKALSSVLMIGRQVVAGESPVWRHAVTAAGWQDFPVGRSPGAEVSDAVEAARHRVLEVSAEELSRWQGEDAGLACAVVGVAECHMGVTCGDDGVVA
jgi:hypothetical protein